MNAIRKILTRQGNSLNVILPDNFTAKQVEVIILPFEDEVKDINESDSIAFRQKISGIFKNFNADLSGFNFNRDELYDSI